MVGVDHDRQRPRQAAQPGQQFLVHAFGQHDRQAAVDAQAADVRDRAQCVGQFDQLVRGQRQRVAAGQDHLVDVRIGRDGGDCFLPAALGRILRAVVEVAAEAVAAIDRAAAGGDQQGAAAVLLDDPGGLFGRTITHRIEAESGGGAHFLVDWQHLAQQRVGGVARAHAGHEALRHAQRELGHGRRRDAQRGRVQLQPGQQGVRVTQRLAPELLPARGRAWRLGPGEGGKLHGEGACGYHGGRKTVAHRHPVGFPF
ncbi:hypothetical protein G6F57_015592 [Rhizopus arrhizus]|nr:hypothetical protein G6F57_015592 [Rhizopus arrhizus]